MSRKPHYFMTGLFVLVATALGLVGIVLLSSDALHSPQYFLETYLDESVQGIDVGTPFKFRGVKVGNVSEIKMVSSEYDTAKMYVLIRVALSDKEMLKDYKNIPGRVKEQIRQGLRLKLVSQGITGLSFLEAEYYPQTNSDPLEIDWEPKYTYIPSTPAMMTLLSRSVEHLSAGIASLDIEQIGQDIEAITANLKRSSEQFDQFMQVMSGSVMDDIQTAVASLPATSSNLNDTVVSLKRIVTDSDRDVEQVLSNLRYITDDTRELIRMIKRYPGMLLSEPPKEYLNSRGKK